MTLRHSLLALIFNSCSIALAGETPEHRPAEQQRDAGRVVAIITVLEGTVRMGGVEVELRAHEGNVVIAMTTTDGAGQVTFPDVPPGRYDIRATRPGFLPSGSTPFDVRAGETAQVLLDLNLTFVAPSIEVSAATSPTQNVQPVSSSDMLAGSVLEIAPVEGDDFQSLLPLLPGVVRGTDGRLRAKGGQATQSALQISSASLTDPSTGDFDFEVPGQSIESVELLANPFAAEYGRFSTSVTQIRSRRGTNDWVIKPGNLFPRFRKGFNGLRGFEPRFSIGGPLRKDRLFFAQDFQYRYVRDPVKSLPGRPEIGLTSFDSFTRVDGVFSARHSLGGLFVFFPRRLDHLTMNTFRPAAVTPRLSQEGASLGLLDRFAISPVLVLESTLAARWFEIDVNTEGRDPMIYAPSMLMGSFFSDHDREVGSLQIVEALSLARDGWAGQHLFKIGLDFQDSRYIGSSTSRPVEVRRLDGSLAERTVFGPETPQNVTGAELALFAQDRWRIGSRITLEIGARMDKEDVIGRANWSPRGGVSVAVLPEGRAILRGGVGKFRQRTPLNIGAFEQFESRHVTRFAPDGRIVSSTDFSNVASSDLSTPEAVTGNIEWNQRFGRRVLLKANYLRRHGSHEYLLDPQPSLGDIHLTSTGRSRYWEVELTGRYLGSERRDVTVSYVRSRSQFDLNNYDQFYGNIRNPLVRANEYNLSPTDVPNRLLIRGIIGLPGQWDFAPVIEMRSGFPWSAVNEVGDFVGPRNRAGRLPRVRTLDFTITRPWRVLKYRFRAGLKVYNALGSGAGRDVQNNITSPEFGHFYNPLERSIGFQFGSAK